MGFLERFFSPDNVHSAILTGCLFYLIKTERRIARLEGVIESVFKLVAPQTRKGEQNDGN